MECLNELRLCDNHNKTKTDQAVGGLFTDLCLHHAAPPSALRVLRFALPREIKLAQ